jgi:hypothetical protein
VKYSPMAAERRKYAATMAQSTEEIVIPRLR